MRESWCRCAGGCALIFTPRVTCLLMKRILRYGVRARQQTPALFFFQPADGYVEVDPPRRFYGIFNPTRHTSCIYHAHSMETVVKFGLKSEYNCA